MADTQNIENTSAGLRAQIEDEIKQYQTGVVQVSEDYAYSEYKLKRRIHLFETHTYPSGKWDSQGNYKYWFDIIASRIDSEVKNIAFGIKDFFVDSERKVDELLDIIVNLRLPDWLRKQGQDEEIDEAVEELSGWGNIVWKKVVQGFERMDLKNFYVINQSAETLDQSPVIERHQFTASDLRAMIGVWDTNNVEKVLKEMSQKTYKTELQTTPKDTTVPYYEIYERNGEVSIKDLKEGRGEEVLPEDENQYVFAKVIAAGTKSSSTGVTIQYILYINDMPGKNNCDLYKEAHRGRYKGKWFREGIYELLFDIQVRANMIGNQIAQGLEYASRIIFSTSDKLIIQNVLSDMKNGDVIKAANLAQVPVRMEGFDQLVGDWNRLMQLANDLTNSNQIVQGQMPSNISFRLGAMLNQNSSKLYDFIRSKLAVPYSEMFEGWILPMLLKDLQTKDVLQLTGDSEMLDRLYTMLADSWYLSNLIAIGPHTDDLAQTLKAQEIAKLKARPKLMMTSIKALVKDYLPSIKVDIAGDRDNTDVELQTLGTFIGLEQDPVRRTALIEMAMKKKGMDVGGLPKSPPPTSSTAMLGSGNAPAQDPLPHSDPYPQAKPHATGYVGGTPLYTK